MGRRCLEILQNGSWHGVWNVGVIPERWYPEVPGSEVRRSEHPPSNPGLGTSEGTRIAGSQEESIHR